MTFETLVAIIVSGTVAGSLYALMASGLSLVWGTLRGVIDKLVDRLAANLCD